MQARVDQAATKLENLDLVTEVTMEALLNPLVFNQFIIYLHLAISTSSLNLKNCNI